MQSKWVVNDDLEGLQDGFFALDFEWRFTYVNQRAVRSLGKDQKNLIGKVIWEESPSIIGSELEKAYRKAMEIRVPQRIEMKGLDTGTWYNILVYPTTEGISIYWHDISNHILSEENFEKTDEKYQKLLNSIDQGYFVIDVIFDDHDKPVDIYCVEANEASKRIVGENYAGRFINEIIPNYESYCFEIYAQIAITGKSIRMEQYAGLHKKWYSFNVFKIGDENSRRVGIIFRDITERKLSEEKAQDLIEKLRKEDQNKNNFLNTLSHELRNPMASIMMSLSLMDNINPSEVQFIRAKEIAKRQVNQLSGLVDDLLEVTRINTNKIKLKMQRLELNDLIQKSVSDYQTQFAKKELLLIAELSSIPLYVLADPVRITQVIGNLLHNSAKFTEKGGKTIVKVEMNEMKSDAIIKVIDNGIGINGELLPTVFNPFTQADTSIDRINGGLGLGLAIVKGIVELHSGKIEVFSEGFLKGSEFTISLPLLDERDDVIEKEMVKEKLSSSPFRILIIDDNKDLAEIMCELIGFLGNKTLSAFNGADGIRKVKEFHPQVIICDVGLPDMSGNEVAKKIRDDDELKGIYLIALSGYASHEDIERSRQAGFDRHIAKPVDIETLKMILNEVVPRTIYPIIN